ncbi:MAG: DUF5710 domain-containing protein, partial [Burkholderiaceae bacterium]
MRINLVTPFAEKDAAKALGARWDSAQKTWYVTNVTDLGPFLRWMPNPDMPVTQSVPRGPAVRAASGSGVDRASAARGTVTVSI